MRDLEHRNIPPIEKQPYQVSSEYQALIDTQDIFCEQVRGAISLRNQTIVREIKQLAETKTTNPDFLQFKTRVLDVLLQAAEQTNLEPVLAEFTRLLIEGTFAKHWPSLREQLDHLQASVLSNDQQIYDSFYESDIGKQHAVLLPDSPEFALDPMDKTGLNELRDFLTTPEGEQLVETLLGDLYSEDITAEGILFSTQRQFLTKQLAVSDVPEQKRVDIVNKQIEHLKDVTRLCLQLRPHDKVAALLAAVHDNYKYRVGSNNQIVTELALHELLSAQSGSQLLVDVLQHYLPEETKSQLPIDRLHTMFAQVIFAHGPEHFPDKKSASQPLYNEEKAQLRVLFGSVYPVCITAQQLPDYLQDSAQLISASDKKTGTKMNTLFRYHLETPTSALVASETLPNYIVERTLASFLDCTQAHDVEQVFAEFPIEKQEAELKVAILIGLAYLHGFPGLESNHTAHHRRLQYGYSLSKLFTGVLAHHTEFVEPTAQRRPSQLHKNMLKWYTEAFAVQSEWQELMEREGQTSFFLDVLALRDKFTQGNRNLIALAEEQLDWLIATYYSMKSIKAPDNPTSEQREQLAEQFVLSRAAFDRGYQLLLRAIDSLDVGDVAQKLLNSQKDTATRSVPIYEQAMRALQVIQDRTQQEPIFDL